MFGECLGSPPPFRVRCLELFCRSPVLSLLGYGVAVTACDACRASKHSPQGVPEGDVARAALCHVRQLPREAEQALPAGVTSALSSLARPRYKVTRPRDS